MVRFKIKIFFIMFLFSTQTFAAPSSFTYQGQIIKPDGHPLEGNNVQFIIEILSPGGEACLLYQESHILNMSNSNGVFSLQVGSGSREATSDYEDVTPLLTALSNTTGIVNPTTCDSVGSYTPVLTDSRKLRLTFDDGTGPNTIDVDHDVVSVPYAASASTIDGMVSSDLLQVNTATGFNLSQTNLNTVFTDTNWTELQALLNGTSSSFSAGGGSFTTAVSIDGSTDAAQLVIDANGTQTANLVEFRDSGGTPFATISGDGTVTNSTDLTTKNYVDTAVGNYLPLGGGTMSGGINMNSNTITNAGNISGTGSLSMNGLSTGTTLALYNGANYVGFQAPGGAGNLIWTLPGSDGGNGDVLTTNGSGILSWTSISPTTTVDTDGDTQIQVEEGADDDTIRFDTAGNERMVIDPSGNVGIGSSTPTEALDVNGDIRSYTWNAGAPDQLILENEATPITAGQGSNISFKGGSTWLGKLQMAWDATNNSNAHMAFHTRGSNVTDEKMRLTAEGYLGIGTTAPVTELDILQDSSTPGIIIRKAGTGGVARMSVLGGTTGGSQLYLGDTADNDIGMISYSHTNNSMSFHTNAVSDRMVIDASGNVGVGTTTPSQKLDVEGRILSGAAGTLSGETGSILMEELAANESAPGVYEKTGFRAPNALGADLIYTLPSTAPAAGYILSSDASGNLSWVADDTGGSGDFLANGSVPMTGVFEAIAGSAGTPGITFDGDENTGIYSLAADQLGFTVGGSRSFSIAGASNAYISGGLARFSGGNAGAPAFSYENDINTGMFNPAVDQIAFSNNGSETIRIDASGNVGIGTTTPSGKLDIEGGDVYIGTGTLTNGTAGDDLSVTGNVEVDGAYYGDGSNLTGVITSESQNMDDTYNNGSSITVDTSDVIFNLTGTNDFHVQDNGAVAFTVADNANVGIGTTVPGEKLDVEGSILSGPKGTSAGDGGAIRFEELAANIGAGGMEYVGFRAPDAIADGDEVVWELPAADGTNGQILQTNGSGVLSWVAQSSGTVTGGANVGTAGVGPFKQLNSGNLEFFKINAGSNKVTVTADGPNDEIDIDVAEANIDHDALSNFVANEHVDHSSVSVATTAGTSGLSGGGNLTATRNIAIDIAGTTDVASAQGADTLLIRDDDDSGNLKEISRANFLSGYLAAAIGTGAGDVMGADAVPNCTSAQKLQMSAGPVFTWSCVSDEDTSDHGALTGLTDDDHTQYALLAGRAGGQSLIGGTAASDDLTLESTSNATKGDVNIQPNGGNVTIGSTGQPHLLNVWSDDSTVYASSGASRSPVTDGTGLEVRNTSNTNGSASLISLSANNANGLAAMAYVGSVSTASNYDPDMVFGVSTGNTNYEERLRILNNGNIGVGTTAPGEKLDVEGSILSGPKGTSAGDGGAIKFEELAANVGAGGVEYVGFRAPDAIADGDEVIWELPAADGTSGQVLQTNGSGVLSWTPAGATDHGALTGLTDDDHTQYALLAGRAGGQSLIGGTAASNDLTLESTSDATKGDVLLQPNGGNVGIGTATPSVPLHVSGGEINMHGSGDYLELYSYVAGSSSHGLLMRRSRGTEAAPFSAITTNDVLGDIRFAGSNNSGWTEAAKIEAVATGGGSWSSGANREVDLAFHTNDSVSYAERMRINASGNVGIGTNAPAEKLDVEGSILSGPKGTTAGDGGAIKFEELAANIGAGGVEYVGFRAPDAIADGNEVIWELPAADGTNGQVLQTNGSGVLSWVAQTSGADDLGNHTATADLNMSNNNITNLALGAEATPSLSFNGNAGTGLWSPAADTVAFSTGTTERMRIDSSGNIGINAPTTHRLAIRENGAAIYDLIDLSNTSGNDDRGTAISFTSGSVQSARIASTRGPNTASGDLHFFARQSSSVVEVMTYDGANEGFGIGTTDPGEKLDVEGSILSGPKGTTAGDGGAIKFEELAANIGAGGVEYVGFRAPDAIADGDEVIWELPAADGTNGQVLQTNGSGVLSWVAQATTPPAGNDREIQFNGSGSFSSSSSFLFNSAGDLEMYGGGATPGSKADIDLFRYRGSLGTPTTLLDGDMVGTLRFNAHDGTAYRGYSTIGVEINDTSISSNDIAMDFVFKTGEIGSYEKLRIPGGELGQVMVLGEYNKDHANVFTTGSNSQDLIVMGRDPDISAVAIDTIVDPADVDVVRVGGTAATPAAVSDGDIIGRFRYSAHDGTTVKRRASIAGVVNGAVSTNTIPIDIVFNTGSTTSNGAEQMRLTSDGDLGIGTDNPSGILDIEGGDVFIGTGTLTNGTAGDDLSVTGNIEVDGAYYGDGSNLTGILTSESQDMDGTYNNGSSVTVDSTDVIFNLTGTNDFHVQDNGTTALMVADNGDVGIGTSAPYFDLDVTKADQDTQLYVLNSSSTAARYPKIGISNYDGAGLGGFPMLQGINRRGNSASPTAIQSGDTLFNIEAAGSSDTAWATRTGGGISFVASENFTNSASGGEMFFLTTPNGSTTAVERMRIDNAGNVGIGTDNPYQKLAVVTTGTDTTDVMLRSDNSVTLNLERYITSDASPKINLRRAEGTRAAPTSVNNNSSVGELNFGAHDGSNFIGAAEIKVEVDGTPGTNDMPGRLIFTTTADGASTTTERMRIDSDGNVGIGTADPSYNLDIRSDSFTSLALMSYSNTGYPYIRARRYRGTAAAPTAIQSDDTLLLIEGSGYDGSTTSSQAEIRMRADENWTASAKGTHITFETTPNGSTTTTERMRIDSAGDVGIGSVAPRVKLDVNGAFASAPAVSDTAGTVDFSSSNFAYTSSNCGTFNLHNMKDGATYTFAVQGTSSTTCAFNAYSGAGSGPLTVMLPPGHGATTATKETLYSFVVIGSKVYVAWVPGY